ncbi:hypothetical protein H5410_061370 [Solanum commersonii]|uniref:Uncharacterized protein n=1 Tax=Solanum commersonii TaxID=4109 RepID=A0A9J5W8P1_SOLCO|nr:hypothetical protein H5410_061370 [Solanum commersonii]
MSLRCGLRLAECCLFCLYTGSDWRSVVSFAYIQASIGGIGSMFAMYNLWLADFDDVCYVQPLIGRV